MKTSITRRKFIGVTAMAGAGMSLAASPFAIYRKGAPSRKITVAIMGIRSRGNALAKVFAAREDCEVAYLCEVDERYFEKTLKEIAPYQKKKPKLEKGYSKSFGG